MVRKKLKDRTYKRLDVFQHEMLQVIDQVCGNSGRSGIASGLHRASQLFHDVEELRCHFIRQCEEVCSGCLQSRPIRMLKCCFNTLHVNSSKELDESDALLVNERYTPLKIQLNVAETSKVLSKSNENDIFDND